MPSIPGPVDDAKLKAIINAEIVHAQGWLGGELSSQRRRAMEYYYGEPFGNEQEGRSKVVLQDVLETVEWLLPELLKIFASGDEVVKFEPVSEEDEEAAKQATDYINYVFFNDNNGFKIFHDLFKQALLSKTAEAKVYWDDTPEEKRETYTGLTLDQVQELQDDPEVEIVEQRQQEPEEAVKTLGLDDSEIPTMTAVQDGGAYAFNDQGGIVDMLPEVYDLTIKRTIKGGRIKVETMPPEEFLISRRAISLEDPPFVAHKTKKTASELLLMGFDKDQVKRLVAAGAQASDEWNEERIARFDIDDEQPYLGHIIDESMRETWIIEGYLRIDYDGDGIAELRRIVAAGDQSYEIMENEPADEHPFISLTPIPIPHKYHGLSMADLVMDIQLIRSTILRQWLDNIYNVNNGSTAVWGDKVVDIDQLLTNRPQRVVVTKANPAEVLMPLVTQPIGDMLLPALEWLDQVKEARTGVTRHSQGLDPDALNKTATGINLLQQAAQQRKELIARVFAETGIKDLFGKMLRLAINHQDRPRTIRLRNKWVEVDPKNWNASMDLTVSVGLGHGNKDAQALSIGRIIEMQERIIQFQGGVEGPVVTLEELHNSLSRFTQASGFKSSGLFFKDPQGQQMQPKQQQPDPKLQAEMAKLQFEGQKLEFEKEKVQLDVAELKIKQGELDLERQKVADDAEFQRVELQAKINTDQAKLTADTEIALAQLQQKGVEVAVKTEIENRKIAESAIDREPQVINLNVAAGGKKTVTVKRDAKGNITGADVTEDG